MNEIVNKVLLAREKFMPQMHLRQRNAFNPQCLWTFYSKQRKVTKI